eukprot:419557_1
MIVTISMIYVTIFSSVFGCNEYDWEKAMQDLISRVEQRISGVTITPRIRNSILSVDRDCFVDDAYKDWSYNDHPVEIPNTIQATISAPHMHLYALGYLSHYINRGSCVLDVGSGSGYLTAVISRLVGKTGIVIGIDYQSELIKISTKNIEEWSMMNRDKAYNIDNIHLYAINIYDFDINNYQFENKDICLNGFDAIHVGASANSNVLNKLISMMKSPSRMLIPIKENSEYSLWPNEHVYIVDKDKNGNVSKQKLFGVRYVPLIESYDNHSDL